MDQAPSSNTRVTTILALLLTLSSAPLIAADVTYTIGSSNGSLRPLLGINIGPLPAAKSTNADLTGVYKALGVNLIRNHDFYGPLDMATMYPNRTKDPSASSSYNFSGVVSSEGRSSDTTYGAIVNNGFEPYFRLGDSYNNATPPTDSELSNWVQAAINVLRHYREGQWGGFTNNFRYVEIWNEPDNPQFWPKPYTQSQYLTLYDTTAKALRSAFPTLKIGGPGVTPGGCKSPDGQAWVRSFLDSVKSKGSPFDFFSWHIYTSDPADFPNCAAFFRQELDSRGFTGVKTILSEWNTPNLPNNPTEALEQRANGKGAALLTGGWIALQQRDDIEQTLLYRGTDPDVNVPSFYGIYTADGKPKKIALAFDLWHDMTAYTQRLTTGGSLAGMYVLAAENSGSARAILVANTNDSAKTWTPAFSDGKTLADYQIAVQTVSDADAAIQVSSGVSGGQFSIPAKAVQLVTLTPNSTTVAEFYNSSLDHYFITANATEAAAIDGGSAGAGWTRTGLSFKSGGGTPACRFYGSVSPGPNSHFYTVDAAECAALKQLQASTPGTQKRWNYESLDFLASAATNGACPSGTVAVYRAYNNGSTRGVDSNHRITSSQTAIQQVVARGWSNEGVVMCAPL